MNRIKIFFRSSSYAMRGLSYALRKEKNFQNELAVAFVVILMMVYFHVKRTEIIVLLLVIASVLILELLNTIMERVVDILKPRVHPYARLIKDLMAGVVLISSIFAIIIGIIIFLPYISSRWL